MSRESEAVADWELLAQISQGYRHLSDRLMEQIGIHRAPATLLCRLFLQDGLTQSVLAEQLSIQGASVTQVLQRMEEAGWVRRERDAEDNRLVRVYLTQKGREQERSITEQFMKLQETVFAGIGSRERAFLRELLSQMQQNMNRRD
jgi:MarR family transcriptional regulator, organic hydroperoxide resistance regulator